MHHLSERKKSTTALHQLMQVGMFYLQQVGHGNPVIPLGETDFWRPLPQALEWVTDSTLNPSDLEPSVTILDRNYYHRHLYAVHGLLYGVNLIVKRDEKPESSKIVAVANKRIPLRVKKWGWGSGSCKSAQIIRAKTFR